MNFRRLLISLLISLSLTGCLARNSDLIFNLDPSWIGIIFSDKASAARYVDKADKEWLAAAAYFVYIKHERFTSTATLNLFLAEQFDGKTQLKAPFPKELSNGVFLLSLQSGGLLTATITPLEISLQSNDREFTNALLSQKLR